MAGGWTHDDGVNEQVAASLDEALEKARARLTKGESAKVCEECGEPIPEQRRVAVPGVQLCIACQRLEEKNKKTSALYNRRGNKDSQLK